MKLKQAGIEEYDSIIAFYDDVTERTPDMAVYARWSKKKHPTLEGIKAYIEEGSMYLFKEDTVIVGARAITMSFASERSLCSAALRPTFTLRSLKSSAVMRTLGWPRAAICP